MSEQYAYGTEFAVQIVAHWCNGCGIPYGLPDGFIAQRRKDHASWTCPNGCVRHFAAGETDAAKLARAEARETALQDQLTAAIHDAEATRVALLRDRERFSKGVCPCCNRSFESVARHMKSKHPDYDITKVKQPALTKFPCTCGRSFGTLHGLRVHQGWARTPGWDKPDAGAWRAHLTKVVAR